MRKEFSKNTKRQALERSQMRCEASGPFYGLKEGQRCSISLSNGVEFDHYLACSNGGDNSLENCISACPRCHRFKTSQFDTPRAAKTKRQSDKAKGIVRPKGAIKSAGFAKAVKPSKALSKPLPPRKRDIFGRPVSEGARP
ncbi:MAG: HNH endonuclease [Candidatus Ochrobactrum gambitense]|nr:MAG: HNH endonuclease [Candidatus Ochrobactrum gambitense]WEK17186.1 MAG: HNH endonuclease signature motif containing protein [Candidatus Ochrobactrum gambitense]